VTDQRLNFRIPVWPNRDPLQEKGGFNLYQFVLNDPINFMDDNGHDTYVPYPYPHYISDPPPLPPDYVDSAAVTKESWIMLGYLGAGGLLDRTFQLSDAAVTASKDRIKKLQVIADIIKVAKCSGWGQDELHYHDEKFSMDNRDEAAHIGSWDLKVDGVVSWRCGDAVKNSTGKCPCDCVADVVAHAVMTKVYTFRPIGYNTDNAQDSIQLVNISIMAFRETMALGEGIPDSAQYGGNGPGGGNPGPAYNASASFDFDFSVPFSTQRQ